jgi:hypothetical protein
MSILLSHARYSGLLGHGVDLIAAVQVPLAFCKQLDERHQLCESSFRREIISPSLSSIALAPAG